MGSMEPLFHKGCITMVSVQCSNCSMNIDADILVNKCGAFGSGKEYRNLPFENPGSAAGYTEILPS